MRILKLVAAGSVLALYGCQTAPRDARQFEPAGTLFGRVSSTSKLAAPTVVVVLNQTDDKIVHRAFLETNRAFRLPLAEGRYKLFAFEDMNRDGVLGAGEPASVMYSLSDKIRADEKLELPTLRVGLRVRVALRTAGSL